MPASVHHLSIGGSLLTCGSRRRAAASRPLDAAAAGGKEVVAGFGDADADARSLGTLTARAQL